MAVIGDDQGKARFPAADLLGRMERTSESGLKVVGQPVIRPPPQGSSMSERVLPSAGASLPCTAHAF